MVFAMNLGNGFKGELIFEETFPCIPDLALLLQGEKAVAFVAKEFGFVASKLQNVGQTRIAEGDDLRISLGR